MPKQQFYLPAASAPPASRLSQDSQVGMYCVNRQSTEYFHDSGLMPQEVAAEDGTPVEIVKTNAACGGKIVRFELVRYGLMPLVPGIERSDPNIVYLRGKVWTDAPAIAVDGYNYTYAVRGFYVYAFLNPVWMDTATGLPMGSTTIDRTIPGKNVLPAAAFVDPGTAWKSRAPGDDPSLFALNSGKLQPSGGSAGAAARDIRLGQNLTQG